MDSIEDIEAGQYILDTNEPEPLKPVTLHDNINTLMSRMITQARDPKWAESPHAQAEDLIHLSDKWEFYDTSDQETFFRQMSPHILRISGFPEDVRRVQFHWLMQMNTPVDMRDALNFMTIKRRKYEASREEKIYMHGVKKGSWMNKWLDHTMHNQVPLAYHFWAGLFTICVANRRNIYFKPGPFPQYTHQYLFLVGDQSTGKSEAANFAMDVLARLNRQLVEYDPKSFPPRFRPLPEYHVNFIPQDSTPEALVERLWRVNQTPWTKDIHKAAGIRVPATGVLHIDEMSVHFGKDSWNVSKKIPMYTTMYTQDEYGKDTLKGGDKTAKDLCFNIIACSAPEWLRGVVSPDVLQGGFVARTNFIYRKTSKRSYGTFEEARKTDPMVAESLAQDLRQWAIAKPGYSREAILEREADVWLKDMESGDRNIEIAKSDIPYEVGEGKSVVRNIHHVARTAVLLSQSEDTFPHVTLEQVQFAYRVIALEEHHYGKFIERVSKTKDGDMQDKILQYVSRTCDNNGLVKKATLIGNFAGRCRGSAELQRRYLQTLVDDGRLEVVPDHKGKRARDFYRLGKEAG